MAEQSATGKQKKALLKLIEKYHADLADFARQHVMFESGTRQAFHRLMADAGKPHAWTLIAEQEKKVNGKTIRPDGTFKDEMNLVRGYWEAKDTSDNLDAEIERKRKAGYPLSNIIFEDTQTAVLYQHGQRLLSVDMKSPDKLSELVLQFFGYIEPEIEEFEHSVEEFKERVPDLAEGLKKKIELAHRTNNNFKRAFAEFLELCKNSLNPDISQAAVDEMLIQHILTERLIREIFDNPEFVRRNVIAAEVEKVMQAMTSQSFDRNTYLKELDRFYVAIERAARTMTDFSDKQYFLNTVYERFFQGYSVKLADTMGIVYTPQEIVDFMCASVAEVLEKEFGKKLWSEDVYIIDPCTGTGNFIVNLIRRIPKAKLEGVYKHRLFANEIMLLPYYIAALNIEHAFFEQAGTYEAFEGLCFVDTLDMAEHAQGQFGFMTAKNSERVERQKKAPITVIIGNPPYNAHQQNENDQNRNRAYEVIDQRIADTYVKDSSARLRTALGDAYVKFFRYATDRIGNRPGIISFVSNNSFVNGLAFDGFRKHIGKDFDLVYHFDFKGNARTAGEQRKREGGNIFSNLIRTSIGITLLVRRGTKRSTDINYHSVADYLKAEEKRQYLHSHSHVGVVKWTHLTPDAKGNWIGGCHEDEFEGLLPIGVKEGGRKNAIFDTYGCGIASNGDAYVYDYDAEKLADRAAGMIEDFNTQLDRWKRSGEPDDLDAFLQVDEMVHKWIRNAKRTLKRGKHATFDARQIRPALYRPFNKHYYFYHRTFSEDTYRFPRMLPPGQDVENTIICVSDVGYRATLFTPLVTNVVADMHVCAASDRHQCFPFYLYDEDGTNRRENITDWALKQFREHYQDKKIDRWAIFHYVYGLLHHPGYREKFADNLKRELPRIPFAPDFWAFANAGKKLAALHLDYEQLEPWDLEFAEAPGLPLSYRVDDKMRLSKDKLRLTVNRSLTLAGIPHAALEYRLGNRSALEWVVDQYQVSTDKRSGITSDPNRDDDPEYIVRLVGQVIRVSMETMGIVNSLPAYSAERT